MNKQITNKIKDKAKSLGFLDCSWVKADFLANEKDRLLEWLNQKRHGKMRYMENHLEKRLDPRLLVENAKTVLVVLYNYFPAQQLEDPQKPIISKYAYGTDYHFVVKEKLNQLLSFIQNEIIACKGRVFVDSAPVLERAWAKNAGLGWIGKNSNLISVEHGSFFFIGEIIIDAEIEAVEKKRVRDHCGNCTKCIDACPTKAIIADRIIDANLCISYQTIELKGDLDENLKGKFENRVFGCDICQDVCPWNLKSKPHQEELFLPHPKINTLTSKQWHEMDKSLFNQLFKNSAVKRAGFKGLKRNLKFIQNQNGQEI